MANETLWTTSTVYDPKTGLIQSETDAHDLKTVYFYDRRGNQILAIHEVEVREPDTGARTFTTKKVKTGQWTVFDEQGREIG